MWARTCLKVAGGRVRVHGLHHLDLKQNYVFVSNHQSMFDILVIMAYLPFSFCWVAKKELFNVPFFGKCMESIGSIPLDRKDRRSAMLSMKLALDRMRRGASITVFPEGTRAETERSTRSSRALFMWRSNPANPWFPCSLTARGT